MTPHPETFHTVPLRLGEGIWQALQERCRRSGESLDHVIRSALAEALDLELHTIYQVSTAGALVEGVFQGCVQVADLLRHGDFGLGTFEGLDGEGILLEGRCWQARADGRVVAVPPQTLCPFWVVTRFRADQTLELTDIRSWADLTERLDACRPSENVFTALRLRGSFRAIKVRVACKAPPGSDLVSATRQQAEFRFVDLAGTLVGFWTPAWARTINIPGYHLHLLSDDLAHGGHVLDLQADSLTVELHTEDHMQLVLPDTPEFLSANLSGDPGAALAQAEGDQR